MANSYCGSNIDNCMLYVTKSDNLKKFGRL
jgi:hypothetical protein